VAGSPAGAHAISDSGGSTPLYRQGVGLSISEQAPTPVPPGGGGRTNTASPRRPPVGPPPRRHT
jgi:hypothetical protein